jgi:hypothetical protein
MSKETIDLTKLDKWDLRQLEWLEDFCDDDLIVLFEAISSEWVNFDEDHGGCGTKETIFKRLSDDKYFKFQSTHSYDYYEIDDSAVEVTPKEVIITIYE